MSRTMDDSGNAPFPQDRRLHEAFAEELDRPGLEGPSYDAVLHGGTARLRRRRVTVGATFAVASVTAVATAVLATGGGTSRGVSAAGDPTETTPAVLGTTSTSTSAHHAVLAPPTSATSSTASAASTSSTSTPPSHPADVVLASGTVNGHSWQLVRQFTLEQPPPGKSVPPGWVAHWCGELNVTSDGVWTNAGSGGPCLTEGQTQVTPPDLAHPGFSSIGILDPHHGRLGTIVAGVVNPETASVTAQCGSKQFTTKPVQPAGDSTAYYTFTFPNGSDCRVGTLSFFDAAGSRTAFLTDVGLAAGK